MALQGCSSGYNSEVSKLTGKILWPAMDDKGNTSIYCVDTTKNLIQPELYYYSNEYRKLYYPSRVDNTLLLVGRKKVSSNYEIVMLKDEKLESLLMKKDELFYPTAYDGSEIVYLGKNKQQSYLGLYSIDSKTDKVLSIDDIDLDSRPAVTSEGKTLFVKKDGNKYTIQLLEGNENQRDIIRGQYPTWLDNGQQFLYYYDNCIRKYSLESNKSEVIKRNIIVTGTPIISPDKKFIAIFESDSVAVLGGECIDYLRILPLSGKQKVDVKAYLDAGYIYNWGGLEWIE